MLTDRRLRIARRRRLLLEPTTSGGDEFFDNVSLLLPMSGAEAGTTWTDLSSYGHTGIVAVGNAQTDETYTLFDENTLWMAAEKTDYLTVPNHASFNMGAGDFTMEMHVRIDNWTGNKGFMCMWDGSSLEHEWSCDATTTLNQFIFDTGGTGTTSLTEPTVPVLTLDVWHHLAYSRVDDVLYFSVDGNVGTTPPALTATLHASAEDLKIGVGRDVLVGHAGSMANVRITKGVGRYTEDFTPPTEPYPTS
jgi:hypothetical protein